MSTLAAYVDNALRLLEGLPPPDLPEQPAAWDGHHFERALLPAPRPTARARAGELADARAMIDTALADYLAAPRPDYMLLVKAAPGVGKTLRAVRAAEAQAAAGKRVLYCGPRHAFYTDVLALAEHPEWWYEWLPRQAGDEATGKVETCKHAAAIDAWTERGYDGMEFCKQICRWRYINEQCVYHRQKKRREPIIYGQHFHAIAHPLRFNVLIGDENPMSAFLHEWVIKAADVMPVGMEPTEEMTHIMHALTSLTLATNGRKVLSGPALLEQLGGAERVLHACRAFRIDAEGIIAPRLQGHSAADVEDAGLCHLPDVVALLAREAEAALTGQDYPHRIICEKQKLLLLLRRDVSEHTPSHVIWLDATANPALYQELFGRPVQVVDGYPDLKARVHQVWSRANGKGTLRAQDVAARNQLQAQIDGIVARGQYQSPAVITYQDAAEAVAPALPRLHFYAARGTNALETCDALIVAGTPMPAIDAITKQARMVFFRRMAAFDPTWTQRTVAYADYIAADGLGRAYPVGGFWADPDLQAVLWSYREAELIQAAHRVRPVQRECDIWLLSNLPVAELPPTRLLSIQEVFDAPDGIDAFKWDAALYYGAEIMRAQGHVAVHDLADALDVGLTLAGRYLDLLIQHYGWQRAAVPPPSGLGRPRKVAKQ